MRNVRTAILMQAFAIGYERNGLMERTQMATDDNNREITPKASAAHLTDYSKGLKTQKLAAYHAKLILGSYRQDQANDPEVYITAVSHLLSRYPAELGAQLTDPKDGIAGKYKWLPAVAEIKEELDRLQEAERAQAYRAEQLRKQWELRDQVEREEKAEPLEYRIKAHARIMAEYRAGLHSKHKLKPHPDLPAETWNSMTGEQVRELYERENIAHVFIGQIIPLKNRENGKGGKWETPETMRKKHNLTQDQWDAIPDSPKRGDYWQGVRWP